MKNSALSMAITFIFTEISTIANAATVSLSMSDSGGINPGESITITATVNLSDGETWGQSVTDVVLPSGSFTVNSHIY